MTTAGGAINKHKISLVWTHFEQNSDGNGVCDICGDKVVTSGTQPICLMYKDYRQFIGYS